jgi:hypothetical protein
MAADVDASKSFESAGDHLYLSQFLTEVFFHRHSRAGGNLGYVFGVATDTVRKRKDADCVGVTKG